MARTVGMAASVEPVTDGPKAISDMRVDELKAYADENGIDLGDARKKLDILATIVEAEKPDDVIDGEPAASVEPVTDGPVAASA